MTKARTNDRRCIATNDPIGPEDIALRFVLDPDSQIVLDLKGSLPGRGVWLSPSKGALETALKKGGFLRGFKTQASLPDGNDLEAYARQVEDALAASALQKLGLARRAGSLVTGHDSVRDKAKKGMAYLTPADGSVPEVEKLAGFLAKSAAVPHLPLPAGRAIIGEAIGQDAVHMLLLPGGPSRTTLEAVMLWRSFSG